jgi:uncharacterized protein YbjT (DUF2867 family)
MHIVIAGGHGKIALILERLLSRRGDSVAGFIRNPEHEADLRAAGAEALVVDLEAASVDDVAAHLRDADAVVFAAGAGPGSGAARKNTVDRDAAILLADAAETAGVVRYLMISSVGADAEAPDEAVIRYSWPTCAPKVLRTTTFGHGKRSIPPSSGRATSPTIPARAE